MTVQEKIKQGKTYLGIEFGSTRIKAVLTDDTFVPIAAGQPRMGEPLRKRSVDVLP